MVHHIQEFISTYKNLQAYCTQALEKSHNSTKIYMMRQPNKQKSKFIKQLLEKENRMEFYNLKGTTAELLEKHLIIKITSIKIEKIYFKIKLF